VRSNRDARLSSQRSAQNGFASNGGFGDLSGVRGDTKRTQAVRTCADSFPEPPNVAVGARANTALAARANAAWQRRFYDRRMLGKPKSGRVLCSSALASPKYFFGATGSCAALPRTQQITGGRGQIATCGDVQTVRDWVA
jgi:hypothetical protein